MAEHKANILVVTDSRGAGIQSYLETNYPRYWWYVKVKRGKGMIDLVNKALKDTDRWDFDAVIFLGGICDITVKDRGQNQILLRSNESEELVRDLFTVIRPGLQQIRDRVGLVLLATTYGLELRSVNLYMFGRYEGDDERRDQKCLEETVDIFNQYVNAYNLSFGLPTIRTGNKIHHTRRNGSIASSYFSLRDGCHPDEDMLYQNAIDIGRMIQRFL